MKVHDLKKARLAKQAKVACENISDIIRIFDLTTRALNNFKGYKSVQSVISTVKAEKAILESHLVQFKKMKDKKMKKPSGPKVLVFDIETAPILGYVWDLWDQNVGLNQIKQDWFVLSWSAKWLGDPPNKIMYADQRKAKNIEDDSQILKEIWKLLDEADVVVTQNGKRFDQKKLNARFILNGMKPPSSYKHIDTCEIAKRVFGFTSNKLEYLSDKLCKKYRKLKHSKFSGFELWKACLARNIEAWQEMKKYNMYDVLTLEELYNVISPWDNSVNFNLFREEEDYICNCGNDHFNKRGYAYTSAGKYQRFVCTECGAWSRSSVNLFTKEKKASLRRK